MQHTMLRIINEYSLEILNTIIINPILGYRFRKTEKFI